MTASLEDIGPPENQKLAQQIARRLERKIIAMGWPAGRNLGKESKLVEDFGVSRWVAREAIAIAEFDGLLQVRRGRQGGIFVGQPAEECVIAALRSYLLFSRVTYAEVLEARTVIDTLTYRFASERFKDAQVDEIRAMVEHWPAEADENALRYALEVYRRILELTGNRVLHVFGLVLAQLLGALGVFLDVPEFNHGKVEPFVRRLLEIRRNQVEAIVAADPVAAVNAQQQAGELYMECFVAAERRNGKARRRLSASAARALVDQTNLIYGAANAGPAKRSNSLMVQLQHAILSDDLKPGDPFASEAELIAQFKVGRGVLREGIRNLERHSFVTIEEGRHGGLRVATPNPSATIRSAALYFKFLDVEYRELCEVAAELELAAVAWTAARVRKEGTAVLAPLYAAMNAEQHVARSFYNGLAECCGNRVVGLFLKALAPLVVLKGERGSRHLKNAAAATDAIRPWMAELVNMLARGDKNLARRAMLRLREAADKVIVERANGASGTLLELFEHGTPDDAASGKTASKTKKRSATKKRSSASK